MKKCVKCGTLLADNAQFCNVCGTGVQQNTTQPQPVQQNAVQPQPVQISAEQPLPRIAYTSNSMQPQLLGERPKKGPAKPLLITLACLLAVAAAAVLIAIFVVKKPGAGAQSADDPSGEISADTGDPLLTPTPAADEPTLTPAEGEPTLTPGESEPTLSPAADEPTPTPAEGEQTPTPAADEPTPTPEEVTPTKTPEEEMIPDGSLRVVIYDRLRADIIISHSLLMEPGEFYVTFRMPGEERSYEVGFRRYMREVGIDTDHDGVTDGTAEILWEEGFVRWLESDGSYCEEILLCAIDDARVTVQAELAESRLSEDIDFEAVTEYTLVLDRSEDYAERAFSAEDVVRKRKLSEIPEGMR